MIKESISLNAEARASLTADAPFREERMSVHNDVIRYARLVLGMTATVADGADEEQIKKDFWARHKSELKIKDPTKIKNIDWTKKLDTVDKRVAASRAEVAAIKESLKGRSQGDDRDTCVKRCFAQILDIASDMRKLQLRIGMHECTEVYCSTQGACRFQTPSKPTGRDSVVRDRRGFLRLALRRRMLFLNQLSNVLVRAWRANNDIQLMIEPDESIAHDYCCKYAVKGELASRDILRLFQDVANTKAQWQPETSTKSILSSMLCQLQGRRKVSWHEAAALNSGMRLYRCTQKDVNISLGGSRAVYKNNFTGEMQLAKPKKPKPLDAYYDIEPSEREDISFMQWQCANMKPNHYPNVLSYYMQPNGVWPPIPAYLETMLTLHTSDLSRGMSIKHWILAKAWLAQSCVRSEPVRHALEAHCVDSTEGARQIDVLHFLSTFDLGKLDADELSGLSTALRAELQAELQALRDQLATRDERRHLAVAQEYATVGLDVAAIDAARLALFEELLPRFPPNVRAQVAAAKKRTRNKRKRADDKPHVDDDDRAAGNSEDDEESEAHMLTCVAPRLGSRYKLVGDDGGQPSLPLDDMADSRSWNVRRGEELTDPIDGHVYSVAEDETWLSREFDKHKPAESELSLPRDPSKVAELNRMQRCGLAFLLRDMRKRCDAIVRDEEMPRQLRTVLYGAGGVGKSEVTNWGVTFMRLACACNDVVETQAFGGSAAFLVGGSTIHSRYHINCKTIEQTELTGERLILARARSEGKWYDFTDEHGTLDPQLFAHEEKRAREIAGNNEPWGGQFGKILSGDFGQTSVNGQLHRGPVRKPDNIASRLLGARGRLLYRQFDSAAFFEENMRTGAGEEQWAGLLARHRVGDATDDDLQRLVNLQLRHRPADVRATFEAEGTLYCFPRHEYDSELEPGERHHNRRELWKLNQAGEPCGVCVAKDCVARGCRPTANKARGLQKKLWLARGARVAVTSNLAQDFGVVNGAVGTVHEVVYADGVRPTDDQTLPRVVYVKMDRWSGPQFCSEVKNLVPFVPVKLPIDCKHNARCSRTNVPLALAWAWTIHKAQGISVGENKTYKRMVGHLGETEGNQLGRDYTLLSRACAESAIALDGVPFAVGDLKKRMTKPAARARYAALKEEDARLRAMSDATIALDGDDDLDELVEWARNGGARDAYVQWRQRKNPRWTPQAIAANATRAAPDDAPAADRDAEAPPTTRAALDADASDVGSDDEDDLDLAFADGGSEPDLDDEPDDAMANGDAGVAARDVDVDDEGDAEPVGGDDGARADRDADLIAWLRMIGVPPPAQPEDETSTPSSNTSARARGDRAAGVAR